MLAYFANKYPYVVLVANDKDFKQLVSEDVMYYNFSTEKLVVVEDPAVSLHCLICEGDDADAIPAVVPRKEDGYAKFQFGEKTIPKKVNKADRNWIDAEYLEEQKKKGNITDEDIELLHANYARNKELIDLSRSPIHNEVLVLPKELSYNSKYYADLLYNYLLQGEAERVCQKMNMIFGEIKATVNGVIF